MPHFYFKLIVPIVVILLAFVLIAHAIGSTQPPNPALRGFMEGCEDKPQPCWYGIVPGTTTLDEALQVMDKMGYPADSAQRWDNDVIFHGVGEMKMTVDFYNFYFPNRNTNIVTFIYLRDLGNLQLIDTLAFFGSPTEISLTVSPNDYIAFPPSVLITLEGHYRAQLSQSLSEIALANYYPAGGDVEWKGRIRRNTYCELQAEKTGIGCQ